MLTLLAVVASPSKVLADAGAPRLAVLLVIDQLGRDRLDTSLPALTGGLGKLLREGRVFTRAELAHAAAETCPGHAALATGRHPGAVGLPNNYSVDRESGIVRYCVEDEVDAAGVLGSPLPLGRSPRRMRSDALGDWLQLEQPGALVLAISAKDRSAIALGGRHPTAAYWLLRSGDVFGFTTSRYYAPELPRWVRRWNGWKGSVAGSEGLLARVPARWVHRPGVGGAVDPRRPDDYAHESAEFLERTSEHRLRTGAASESAGRVYRSPYVDALTLDFAAAAAQQLGLGDDEVPDLLAVSLSGTDTVGHEFGPESHEARDALLRLDEWLGSWLSALEARVGSGRIVVALSSDHGVLPIPEWQVETGRSRCPVRPARVSLDALRRDLGRQLNSEFGHWYQRSRKWFRHAGLQMTLDRAGAVAAGVEAHRVIAAAEAWLEGRPDVAAVWTASELADSADPMARRYRRSRDPERSGDLALQPAEGCLISRYQAGTSHGTPYAFDTAVPIVLWGPGVAAGRDDRAASTIDVAPSLAKLLGIRIPEDLDGAALLD